MYKVGKPEVRKYCSPLQAIFWLSEDGHYEEMNKIIDTYSLKQLISKAWNFGSFRRSQYKGKVLELSEVEANNIVGSLAAADPEYKVVFVRVLDLTTKKYGKKLSIHTHLRRLKAPQPFSRLCTRIEKNAKKKAVSAHAARRKSSG